MKVHPDSVHCTTFMDRRPLAMSQLLTTDRLILREVREDDVTPMFLLIYHNPNVLKTFLAPYIEHLEDASIDSLLRYQELGKLIYIIEKRDTHEVIGLILEQEQTIESIEVGYAIGEPFWNQGYATEVLQAVIEHLFHLEYQRVTAECFLENAASAKVMEKCGMNRTEKTYEMEYFKQRHTVIEYEIYAGKD